VEITDVVIKPVSVSELPGFIDGILRKGESSALLPTVPLRAGAQAANPQAEPDEVALLVAYQDDRCIGYIGLLPNQLHLDGRVAKIDWLSTWYVPPLHRHSLAGVLLMQATFRLGRDLFVTGVSRKARKLYERLGFKRFGPLRYGVLVSDPLGQHLDALWRRLCRMGFPARLVNGALQTVRLITWMQKKWRWRRMLNACGSVKPGGYTLQKELPAGAFTAMKGIACFVRDRSLITWMLDKPWIEAGAGAVHYAGYAFSARRERFEHNALCCGNGDAKESGVVVIQLSRDALTTRIRVLDTELPDTRDPLEVLAAVLRYAADEKADVIELPLPWLQRAPQLLQKYSRIDSRDYFYRPARRDKTEILTRLGEIDLHQADGDTAYY